MSIELPIHWKIQGVNMGCFPACLAMLISQPKKSYETWEVMERLLMPYRIEISHDHDLVLAGSAVEYDSLTNQVSAYNFGLELFSARVDNQKEFLKKASELLHQGKAFITSITVSGRGHTIVVYGMDKNKFMIHDPDNGVRYTRPVSITNYPTVPKQIISQDDLLALARRGARGMFVLGHLEQPASTPERPPLPSQLLNDRDLCWDGKKPGFTIGIAALQMISDKTKRFGEDFQKSANIHAIRESYHSHGTKYLKPLTKNLYGAIVASGIVHFGDIERRRINTAILETLEQIYESFVDGLNQLSSAEKVENKIMQRIIQGLDELVILFTALAELIGNNEKNDGIILV
jgi:hypothetical protein